MSKPQIEGVIKETGKYQYLSSASNPHTFWDREDMIIFMVQMTKLRLREINGLAI